MTAKEAIKILHKDTSMEAVDELIYHAGFNRDKAIEQIQEAMTMGVEALEKQIPKKSTEVHEKVDKHSSFYCLSFMCPSCETAVIFQLYKPKYCKHCGQKLDWGD